MSEIKSKEDLEIKEALETGSMPIVARNVTVDQIALMEPKRAAEVIQARISALETMRKAAIKATQPEDWVGFKDNDGNISYILASSGAVKVRKYFGISTYNLRPESPEIHSENDKMTAVITGDGYCGLTGEVALNVVGCRSDDEHFTGRGTVEDLKLSARTSLETKVVRVLAGMVRIPEAELKECGIDTSRTRKGSGFGTSAERKAGKVVGEDIKKLQDDLRDKLLRYTGGDEGKAAEKLVEITKSAATEKNPKGFAGYNKVSAMTLDWALKKAIEKIDILMSEGGAE